MRGECLNPRDDCHQQEGAFSDEHHKVWPASSYLGPLAVTYRNLPGNREQVCRCVHDEIHASEAPPERPSNNEMRRQIRQACEIGAIALTKQQKKRLHLEGNN